MSHNRLYFLFALWGFTFILQSYLPESFGLTHLILVTVSLVLMMFFRTNVNFLIILSVVLTYGFGLTFYALGSGIFDREQYVLMAAHLLLTGSLIVLWLIIHDIKALIEENKMLKERVALLEKFDHTTQALSMPEFMERGLIIETGMNRRNEKGQLLYLKVKDIVPMSARDSLRHYFIKVCLETIRTEYDLVTSPNRDEVFIFLQGTDEKGKEVVAGRLAERLKQHVNYVEMPYEIGSHEIGSLASVMNQLQLQKGA